MIYEADPLQCQQQHLSTYSVPSAWRMIELEQVTIEEAIVLFERTLFGGIAAS